MKTLKTLLVLLSLLFGSPIVAGTGHDHGHSHAQDPVSQEVAKRSADKVMNSLIERKKIDKSWSSISANSVNKKIFNDRPEWIVIYTNEKITDPDKRKLYIFLTIGGEYIAVNYTGN